MRLSNILDRLIVTIYERISPAHHRPTIYPVRSANIHNREDSQVDKPKNPQHQKISLLERDFLHSSWTKNRLAASYLGTTGCILVLTPRTQTNLTTVAQSQKPIKSIFHLFKITNQRPYKLQPLSSSVTCPNNSVWRVPAEAGIQSPLLSFPSASWRRNPSPILNTSTLPPYSPLLR